jgi:hypothetical protein
MIHPHLAFLAGAALAVTAETMVAYWVTRLLGRAAGPSGQGTFKTVIDWLVIDAGKQPSWDLALLWDGVASYPRAQRRMDDQRWSCGYVQAR